MRFCRGQTNEYIINAVEDGYYTGIMTMMMGSPTTNCERLTD